MHASLVPILTFGMKGLRGVSFCDWWLAATSLVGLRGNQNRGLLDRMLFLSHSGDVHILKFEAPDSIINTWNP